MTTAGASPERLVRAKEFCERLSIGKTKFGELLREGKIPPPVMVGSHLRLWPSSVVDDIIRKVADGSLRL